MQHMVSECMPAGVCCAQARGRRILGSSRIIATERGFRTATWALPHLLQLKAWSALPCSELTCR